MKKLPEITPLLVPTEVTNAYVSEKHQDELRDQVFRLYKEIEAEEFKKTERLRSDNPSFTIVAGTLGVGRSKVVNPLSQRGVLCDAFKFLKDLPLFREAFVAAHHDEHAAPRIIDATRLYQPAAKWISDMLMTEAVKSGRPVVLETRAQTKHIGAFMDNVNAAVGKVDVHICQAPFSVKLQGAIKQVDLHGDIAVDEAQLRASDARMMGNMPVLASKASGNLTIHWREQLNKPLQIVATTTSETDYSFDEALARRFGQEFGFGIIQRLMGTRNGTPMRNTPLVMAPGPQERALAL